MPSLSRRSILEDSLSPLATSLKLPSTLWIVFSASTAERVSSSLNLSATAMTSVIALLMILTFSAIFLPVLLDRLDSLRTSSATTAKPRPDSPARAASMAALSASKLVCEEISSTSVAIFFKRRCGPPCSAPPPPPPAPPPAPPPRGGGGGPPGPPHGGGGGGNGAS